MPLVRLQVRNEFGLGKPELYSEVSREDPKAVLDGVAVSGLVGILRQLGDLAEFSAEVFHGLQEQVTTTASRSQNLMVRVQRIEATLPPLEKRVLAQTSHLHFAYTAGSDWHARIRNEQHHFIDNDLPRFIMDSYEECRDPPRLHLLDKFDTGGPGSCLRRYSDPTFFRRVSTKFDELDVVKIQNKKSHKIKKKRSFTKNGEYSRGTSMSKSSSRMQFSSPAVNGRTSPTVSVGDLRFKSGVEDRVNSFDSRSGSGYIECVFNQNENVQLEELGSNRSSSSRMMRHEASVDSVYQDEENLAADSSSAQETSQDHVASNASCVSWEEKTEIVEPSDRKSDQEEPSAMISTYSDVDQQEEEVMDVSNVSEYDVQCAEDNMPKSFLHENQVDDIENEPDDYVEDMSKSVLHENQVDDIDSEPDSYVDALNTIESESETDHEYQTKREVEPCLPKIGDTEMRVSVEEPMSHRTVHHDSSIRPDGTSAITSDNGMPLDLCEPAPPEIAPEVQMLQAAEKLADSDCSPATSAFERSDVHDGSKIESMIQDSPSSGSSPPVNETMSSSPKPHESPAKLAPANFWTNGSLLGLQPAKPVDFAPPSSADSNALMKTKDITADPADLSSPSKSNGGEDKLGVFGENGNIKGKEASSNYPTSFLIVKDSQSTQKTALVSSLADLYARTERSGDSNLNNRCGHTNGGGSSTITLVAPGSAMPVAPTAKVVNVESSKENDENSSGVFGLGHRLFVNSFRKKISLVYDEKSDLASSANARMMERDRDEHCPTYETRQEKTKGEQFEIRSPIHSLPPSPPLEHMKISFHPVNDFETSKMGLRFSDDRSCQESIRDMFASFQLVPEPSLLLRDVGSDSDDDTFCQSSPCMSDDCLSRNSDSNSEQWESGGNAGMKEHDQYDALCRLSSSEFASAPSEQVGLDSYGNFVKEVGSQQADNGVEPLLSYPTAVSGSALNIPSFDTFQSLPKAEYDRESDQKNSLPPQPPGQPAPPPPPLPPAEWRASKPNADMGEEEQQTSEGLKDAAYSKHSVSTVSVQPQPALSKQHHIVEEFIQVTAERKGQPKFAAKEANQGDNGKVEDEKDDFLRQIRTQSFNLRRTVPAKGTTTAAPNANVKVTAILQKANAIRQAVGSDDGEDDSWSDT